MYLIINVIHRWREIVACAQTQSVLRPDTLVGVLLFGGEGFEAGRRLIESVRTHARETAETYLDIIKSFFV